MMQHMIHRFFLITGITALCFGVFFPFSLFAHGADEVGRVEVGEQVIIVDAIVPERQAGKTHRLNVEVEKKDGASAEAKRTDYSDVWIRITGPNDEFLFSGNLHRAEAGFVTGFSYFFANPGTHELTMRFLKEGTVVAEGSVHIEITQGVQNGGVDMSAAAIAIGITALIMGLLLGLWLMRGRGRHTTMIK
jgi:hypothetical protein